MACLARCLASAVSSRAAVVRVALPSTFTRSVTTVVPTVSLEARKGAPAAYPLLSLSLKERQALNAAKMTGFLAASTSTSTRLADAYATYCVAVKRPYVAVHRDGWSVTVSLAPAALQLDTMTALEARFQAVLEARPAADKIQIVNDATYEAQKSKVSVVGVADTLNTNKTAETKVSDSFTVYTRGRGASAALAQAFVDSFVEHAGLPTLAQRRAAAAQRKAAAAAAAERLTVRKLRRLTADPIAMKNLRVPAGVLDGFIAADKRGDVQAKLDAAVHAL